jgi:hypothetical protein
MKEKKKQKHVSDPASCFCPVSVRSCFCAGDSKTIGGGLVFARTLFRPRQSLDHTATATDLSARGRGSEGFHQRTFDFREFCLCHRTGSVLLQKERAHHCLETGFRESFWQRLLEQSAHHFASVRFPAEVV